MDAVRYFIALFLLVAFPAAMSMWFLIHPLAGFWRRRGPTITYVAVVALAGVIGFVLFQLRRPILRVEFGFNWVLTIAAILVYIAGALLERQYRRHLTIATLLGLPEVSENRPSKLLTEGIYSKVRHPRYLGLMCEISATALLVNYLAIYLLVLATVPVLYLTIRLEERELVERFGDAYERYMRQVPRFLPRIHHPGRDSEV